MKPAKKLLNGKVPTSKQYRNSKAPVINMYSKYASITLSLFGVVVAYSFTKREMIENTKIAIVSASKQPLKTYYRYNVR